MVYLAKCPMRRTDRVTVPLGRPGGNGSGYLNGYARRAGPLEYTHSIIDILATVKYNPYKCKFLKDLSSGSI